MTTRIGLGIDLPASDTVDATDSLKAGQASFGVHIAFGGGPSENLAKSRPLEDVSFAVGDNVIAYQIRIQGYYRSLGGLIYFERHYRNREHEGYVHSANSVSLLIAPSYHLSILKHRLRVEAFYGFGHTRDAARVRKVVESGYDYRYQEEFSEGGAAFGGDAFLRPISWLGLHALFVRNTPGIDHDRLKLEALILYSGWIDTTTESDPSVGDGFIVLGLGRAWKEDDRDDRLFYIGVNLGNWAWH